MELPTQSSLEICFDLPPHPLVGNGGFLKRLHLQGIHCHTITGRIDLCSENIELVPTQRSGNHGEYTPALSNANGYVGEPAREILFGMQENGCPEGQLRHAEMPGDLVWRGSDEIPCGHGIEKAGNICRAVLRIKGF